MASKASTRKAPAKKFPTTLTLPTLKKGETYKGLIVDAAGKPLRHVIELTIPKTSKNWADSIALAKKKGYELPDRTEGSLLRASDPRGLTGLFWLREPYEANDGYAWAQGFSNGDLYYCHKSDEFRVRLVRSVLI